MKLQKAIRMQAMLVGLGAMLLLASGARAQQDVSPDTFDVNPGTPAVENAVAAPATPAAAPVAMENVNAESALPAVTPRNDSEKIAVVVMFGAVLIALYTITEKRRQRRLPISGPEAPYSSAS